jgi:Cu+-exporting ATPase
MKLPLAVASAPATVTDPVCKMQVDPASAKGGSSVYAGQTYYFCGPKCKEKFDADPDRYLKPQPPAELTKPAPAGTKYVCPMDPEVREDRPGPCPKCGMALEPEEPTPPAIKVEYTCPMHPQIVRDQPGACPICGMALEPRNVAVEADNPELREMTRRFWFALVLTLPVFILGMLDVLPGTTHALMAHGRSIQWIQLLLSTPVVLWAGWPFFVRGWQSVRNRSLNMFTLIALGTGVAFGYSVVATLFPGLLPASVRMADGMTPVYFEASSVIITLVLAGQVMELRARAKTGSAIRALLGLAPATARRIGEDGRELDVPLAEVQVGDRLRIRPGEKIPVDGTVREGSSAIDESMITGESMPIGKHVGETVIGGTLNGSGTLVIQAERVGSETLLGQIVKMVSQAQRSRAPIQTLADAVAGYFVPAVAAAAAITFFAWLFLGPQPALAHAIINAVAVLIIACPCALGLATPMSVMVGIGRGARAGVLVRDAEAIQRMASVNTLVMDKTGTLTEGKPKLTVVAPQSPTTERELLRIAASLERGSEHPLAAAILSGADSKDAGPEIVTDFHARAGQGVTATISGQPAALGNRRLMKELGIDPGPLTGEAGRLGGQGQTVIFVALAGKIIGLLGVSDPIKPTTAEAIRLLRDANLQLVVLTGDNRGSAAAVAGQLGLTDVRAELLPAQKQQAVEELQKSGRIVAMAGDGVNDAPALAAADVGIAMGTGTDVAIHSSGITLLRGDLLGAVKARQLSVAVMRNIRQNLFFAMIYNALGIPLAAGVLYPFFGILLSPMIAAAAMSLSSICVVSNALRLNRLRL